MPDVRIMNDKYNIDSVYQWDLNRELVIYGLSLPTTPEIHFGHKNTNIAIVQSATMDSAGVIRVTIPNVLLEKSLNIDVYVCLNEGETFRTLYKIVIPVIGRAKPFDYQPDEEVYNYIFRNVDVEMITLESDSAGSVEKILENNRMFLRFNIPSGKAGPPGPPGPQGDPLTYDDLTDEQIKELQAGVAAEAIGGAGGMVVSLTGDGSTFSVKKDGVNIGVAVLDDVLLAGGNVIGVAAEDIRFTTQSGVEYTVPAGTIFRYQNASVMELVGEGYEFYVQMDGHEFAVMDMDGGGNWYGHSRPAQVVLYLRDSIGTPVIFYNGREKTAEEIITLLEDCYNMGRPVLCWQENMTFLRSDGSTVTPPLGNVFRLTRSAESLFSFRCEQDGIEYVVEVNPNGFVPYAEKMSYGISAESLSLTINPVDGKIYITVNGVMVGQGVAAGAPVSYGDVQVDNLILKLQNNQSVTFNVMLSEPPTNPQVVTILSDSDCIAFDKNKLTFTADNYDTYQSVTVSANGITEDKIANIIVRNSDELMTDTNVTVYLKAESYNVDTTVPEGGHVLTEADVEGMTAVNGYGALLKKYTGEYTNVIVPAKITYSGKEYSPVYVSPTTFAGNTAVQYVTMEDGVLFSASATSFSAAPGFSSNFKGCTALIGIKGFPAMENCLPGYKDLKQFFINCSSLKFIDGLEKLVYCDGMPSAFEGCSSLEYVQDLSGIQTNRDNGYTDGHSVFKNCTSLKKVYGIPNFTNMQHAFNGCTALEEAIVPATVGTFNTAINGSNTNTSYANYCFLGCVSLKKITVLTEVATPGLPTSLNNDCVIYAIPDTTVYTELQNKIADLPTATLVPYGSEVGSVITVWGDSTSSLGTGWIDWPTRLGNKISGFTIKNQAISGEYTTSTSARQGGNALKVGAFTIPAETKAVSVALTTEDGHTFGSNPVFSTGCNFNPCTISGVKGSITNIGDGTYSFTRLTAGTAVEVAEGTAVVSDADTALNSAEIMLINLGCNSGWDENPDVLLNQVQLMVNHFVAAGGEKYIICGPYAGKHLRTEDMRAVTFAYEEKAATAFGNHWLNLREYMIANGLTENGLTASTLDTERMALGQVPASLIGGGTTTSIKMYDGISVTDDVHPNAYGANSIMLAFYNKGVALGYWT